MRGAYPSRLLAGVALRRHLLPAEVGPSRAGANLRPRALAVADAAAVVVCVWAFGFGAVINLSFGALVAAVAAGYAFTRLTGLNAKENLVLRRSTLDEAPRLLALAVLTTTAYWLLLPEGPARGRIVALALTVFLTVTVFRAATRRLLRFALPAERCVFIGDGSALESLRNKVDGSRANAQVVRAMAFDRPVTPADLGGVAGLRKIVVEARATRVILAPMSVSSAEAHELIRIAKEAHVQVSILPGVFEAVGTAVEFEDLEGLTLLGVRRFGLSRSARNLKRAFDLVGAGLLVMIAAPLLAVIAIAIKLDTAGPILFRQRRVGRDGAYFDILKFRSMVTDAERLKEELRHRNETEGLFKIADDPRVTRVGRFLRRTSFDELPQILNVLRGEMSLVGPRPLVLDEDQQVSGLVRRRLHLTPGITGPWQVMPSGRVPMQEMVGIDYLYAANWTLWTDIKLLLRTVSYVLSRGGL